MTSTNSTGGGWDTGSLTITTGTHAITDNTYYPTGDWWPTTYWPWGYSYWPTRACGSQDHEFMQARPPHHDQLFCRKCGEVKALKVKRGASK